jgi:hypothetical protein
MVIITTSGDPTHWSRKVFDQAEADPARWRVSMAHTCAPWMDPAEIEAERRRLPDSTFGRLFCNEWRASEDRLFKPDEVRRCVTLTGPQLPEQGRTYALGVDLALRNDRAVVAVGHITGHGDQATVVVDNLDIFTPTKGHEIRMGDVEEAVLHRSRQYNRAPAVFDPAQAWSLMQRLRVEHVDVIEHTFTTASNSRRALELLQLVREQRLALPPDEELIDELVALRLRETSPGVYRFDHDPDRHDDRAVACSLVANYLLSKVGHDIPAVSGWSMRRTESTPWSDMGVRGRPW